MDTNGSIAEPCHSGGDGNFQIAAPHAGNFTLVISEPGFETVHTPVTVAPNVSAASATAAHTFCCASADHAANCVSGHQCARECRHQRGPDGARRESRFLAVLSASDLKALPIFDNDYAGAMSAFLDDSAPPRPAAPV